MYNNNQIPQYTNTGYQNTYNQYPENYPQHNNNYGYQNYGSYENQMSQLPPPTRALVQVPSVPQAQISTHGNLHTDDWSRSNYHDNKTGGLVEESQQPNSQIIRQREDYVKKASVLKNELDQLQKQQQDMYEKPHKHQEFETILLQNSKLQDEVQGKLKAIQNVIQMLSDIIKDGKTLNDLESELSNNSKPQPVTQTIVPSSRYSESNASTVTTSESLVVDKYSDEKICYTHYDTGLHWCRTCDEFPQTAKDFLLHLQDNKHQQRKKLDKVDSTPWHKLPPEPLLPSDENAPKKRIPIKGLQFFVAAPSWYCRLCDVWIGDLHCASHHLKSKVHHQNFEIFTTQNPHWEMEWLKDREKSMTRKRDEASSSDSDDSDSDRKHKKKSSESSSAKDKKKKKKSKKKKKAKSSDSSSSSSSSDSSDTDRSKSIRVAMRNMNEKWSALERIVEEHKKKELGEKEEKEKVPDTSDDQLINQWMAVAEPPAKEKLLLMSLKDRMREKKEQEQMRITEREKSRRQQEQDELERSERKKRDDRRALVEAEILKKQREQEEIQKMKDIHLRFKANNYRKRKSQSPSEDVESYERKERISHKSRSRSREPEIEESKHDRNDERKPPGPPSYKKLPFIGRMPLFKKKQSHEEKEEPKEIKKRSYEPQRKTRFEPGNLPKAYIPKPEVVCFPKLSSIPPLTLPPPPPTVEEYVVIPKPPKISAVAKKPKPKKPPSPPKIVEHFSDDDGLYETAMPHSNMVNQFYGNYGNNRYEHDMYSYPEEQVPHSHSMPLQPPPLPPDDDLALLGICADDMAAQSF
ncbi:zinc finger matrin-type protein CG9776 [Diabrotica virgifera virgifera]|uniref:Zinc finger matrin-type protein CG9776-like n=1 Tax=Diabrotica virgifera virgifera TaxID=50390 RepID=A0ABM5IGB0_DIAVI|nr:zinc finger matrin-type protein CG9776 [Diabrotica virgifera virgifera]